MEREPKSPPELLDIDDLRARCRAYEERCLAEYERADKERTALIELHCRDQNERIRRWEFELYRVRVLNRALTTPALALNRVGDGT